MKCLALGVLLSLYSGIILLVLLGFYSVVQKYPCKISSLVLSSELRKVYLIFYCLEQSEFLICCETLIINRDTGSTEALHFTKTNLGFCPAGANNSPF